MSNHSERDHAKLSASGSARWLACPGSVELESHFEDKESSYAAEGTFAHEVAEIKLKMALHEDKRSVLKKQLAALGEIPKDMLRYIDNYVDRVIEVYNEADSLPEHRGKAEILFEQRLDFSHLVPDGFGTGDVIIVNGPMLWIIDFKYGFVPVSAKFNSQARLYALGALNEFEMLHNIKTVRMIIDQPRIDSYSVDEVSVEELKKWGEYYVKPRAEQACSGNGEILPGSHCKYCKAATTCRVRVSEIQAKTSTDFKLLSAFELAELYVWLKEFDPEKFKKGVIAFMTDLAYSGGVEFPGLKVVQSYARGKITDPDAVIAVLVNDFGFGSDELLKPQELKGLTDLRSLLKKQLYETVVEPFVERPASGPKLVPLSDKGQPIKKESAEEDFKDIEI